MRIRSLARAGGVVVAIAFGLLAPIPVAGQTAQDSKAFLTPWGEPDLQGIWNNQIAVPLERPAEYVVREFLSQEERAELDRLRAERQASLQGRDIRKEGEDDVAGAYNAVWNVGSVGSGDPIPKTGTRTSMVIDPPDGQIPAMTPEAQQREDQRREYLAALLQGTSGRRPGPPSSRRAEPPPFYNLDRMNRTDGPEDRSSIERCLGSMLPRLRGYFRIVQSPGSVVIYYEGGSGGGTRIIPVDGSEHLPSHMRLWHGDARGRWDGDTLVVDTTNFTHKSSYRGSRETLHIIERFKRVDEATIDYVLTIDDPDSWTSSWTLTFPVTRQDDRANRIFESSCQEGNFGMTGMLANTRAAEKAFAEGRGPDPATMDNASGGGEGVFEFERGF